MIEIEYLICNKRTDVGYIFFDDHLKYEKMNQFLKQLNIGHKKYIIITDGHKYFGFRIWHVHKRFMDICIHLKEAVK